MKKITFAIQRILGIIIDLSFSLYLFCILSFCISGFFYLPFLWGWLSVWMIYEIICHFFWMCTLGQNFLGIRLKSSIENKNKFVRFALRDVFTSIPGFFLVISLFLYNVLPYVLNANNIFHSYSLFYIILFFIFLIILFLLLFFRKKIFKIKIIRSVSFISKKERYKLLILYVIILVLGFFSRIANTYLTNPDLAKSAEIEYYAPRPSSSAVTKYTQYLQHNRQDINDYIFDLFKKYDHVILCERFHNEYTQWDMIYNIIKDERFSDIGTIFTEQGRADRIKDYQAYTSTTYSNDSLMEKALSGFLMKNQTLHPLWNRTSWFDFLKRVYYLNQKDSVRINVCFTSSDILVNPDAEKMYDSIMATNIINTIKSKKANKSLIIMNFRHAFLLDDYLNDNCGAYLNRTFPGKIANVLINNITLNYFSIEVAPPIQNGKWDVAFEQMGDSAYAFGFRDSPFGEDKFDLYPFISMLSKKKYEDMFTGMIYYLPLRKHVFSEGYPYMLDGENESLFLERYKLINEEYYEFIKKYELPRYKTFGRGKILYTEPRYFKINKLENRIVYSIFGIGFFVGILLLAMILLTPMETRRKQR